MSKASPLNVPYPTMLEQDLQRLFITYKPQQVMAAWRDVLQSFREALQESDLPTLEKPTVVLNTLIEPVKENHFPKPQPDNNKDANKEKADKHKEAIVWKRLELMEKKIVPESLLTEENLKKWIEQENKNYWTIAEMTGCQDATISAKAKSLNIFSELALKIRKQKAQI